MMVNDNMNQSNSSERKRLSRRAGSGATIDGHTWRVQLPPRSWQMIRLGRQKLN